MPQKILVVLGDGGHTTEMIQLVDLLGPTYQYAYMMSTIDHISADKITIPGPVYRVPLPRFKYKQYNSLSGLFNSTFHQIKVLQQTKPNVILSTGANIAIIVSFFGRLNGAKVIHVETGSRVYTMSSTGKVMYYLAHKFFVQWEQLQKDYPKAIYAGRLL